MLIYPLLKYAPNWTLIHQTWMDWQTYNAAIIALLASFVAYKATVFNYQQERKNNLIAAKSLLPQALDDLCNYTRECVDINYSVQDLAIGGWESDRFFRDNPTLPNPSRDSLATISDCIKYADRELGSYLAEILNNIQLINARTDNLRTGKYSAENLERITKGNIQKIAHLRAKIDSLFSFARDETPFEKISPSDKDINNIIETRFKR